jgi:hypothetical protein
MLQWKAVVMNVAKASALEVENLDKAIAYTVYQLNEQGQRQGMVRLVVSFILKHDPSRMATFWVHWEAGAWLLMTVSVRPRTYKVTDGVLTC